MTQLLDGISEACFTVDRLWRLRFVNRQAEYFLGRPRQLMTGRKLWELFPRARNSVFQEHYQRALREQVTVSFGAFSTLLEGMATLLRRTLGPEVTVQMALEAPLAPLRIDPAQFETAILNLCINARDAMPAGGSLRLEASNLTLDAERAGGLPAWRPGATCCWP